MRVYHLNESSKVVAVAANANERAPVPRPTAWFVVVFLLLTFTVLSAYRYGAETLAMDWYMFEMARQTAWLLDRSGGTGFVENVSELQGREDEVRATLGLEEDTPLTSWHAWRFRALSGRHDLQRLRSLMAKLEAHPADGETMTGAMLVARVEHLESVARLLASGGNSNVARRILQDTARLKAALGFQAASESQREALHSVESRLDELASTLRSEVFSRASRLQDLMRNMGPRVYFVTAKDSDAKAGRSFVYQVASDCGAIPSMAIFLAAVLAFPTSWRRRLLGIGLGVPLLYVLNIARLACLAHIGAWLGEGEGFDFVHAYVWQGLYIAFVVAAWLLWVQLVVQRRCSWLGSHP